MAALEATHALSKEALAAAEQEARAAKEEAGHASAELAKVRERETPTCTSHLSAAPGCEPASARPACELRVGACRRRRTLCGRHVAGSLPPCVHACMCACPCVRRWAGAGAW